MRQQQEFETDALVSIIHAIQLGRATGQLTARRSTGIGMPSEEGTILFANGQVTEARVGRRTGAEALNSMSSWETCRCSFVSSHQQILLIPSSPQQRAIPETPPPTKSVSPLRKTTDLDKAISRQDIQKKALPFASVIPFPIMSHNLAASALESNRFSRTHRQLLLLIDGQRSVTELARIMARTQEDIFKLLQDLEHAALIQIRSG